MAHAVSSSIRKSPVTSGGLRRPFPEFVHLRCRPLVVAILEWQAKPPAPPCWINPGGFACQALAAAGSPEALVASNGVQYDRYGLKPFEETMTCTKSLLVLSTAAIACAQSDYDFLLKGGRVIDGKNKLSAIRDVAIKDGRIAAVALNIEASRALKAVDVSGLYVTPGLIDIHVHVFPGPVKNSYANGDWGLHPDGFTLRVGVTTVADAGSSGWRNFEDFKSRIVDQSKTRVLAFLNIVGAGMGSGPIEQNLNDMEVKPAADMALKYKGVIVGIKSAHFSGPEWTPYENAEEIGRIANIPVMVDFGGNVRAGRTMYDLLNKYFRPGDIFTHMYGGRRGEQDPETKGPSKIGRAHV